MDWDYLNTLENLYFKVLEEESEKCEDPEDLKDYIKTVIGRLIDVCCLVP